MDSLSLKKTFPSNLVGFLLGEFDCSMTPTVIVAHFILILYNGKGFQYGEVFSDNFFFCVVRHFQFLS